MVVGINNIGHIYMAYEDVPLLWLSRNRGFLRRKIESSWTSQELSYSNQAVPMFSPYTLFIIGRPSWRSFLGLHTF